MTGPAHELGACTTVDVASHRPLLLVPTGSCEQHGPHLPLDTDTRIAVAVATEAATLLGMRSGRPVAVVAPAIGIGASGEHDGFAGTLSVGETALELVVTELVRSADHFAGVVVVNAHGGNARALQRAARTANHDGRRLLVWHASVPGGDAHAGRTETSVLLALAPHLVATDRLAPGNTRPLAELLDLLGRDGVRAVSPNGVLGDPTGASAEEGQGLLDGLVGQLVAAVESWPRSG